LYCRIDGCIFGGYWQIGVDDDVDDDVEDVMERIIKIVSSG
jgi:hypothetical protein